jgi:hypothetical protein
MNEQWDWALVSHQAEPRTYDASSPSLVFLQPDSVNVFVEPRKLADVPNGKVLVVGLQKSGNTWLHSLLADSLDYPYLFHLHETRGRGVLSTHLSFCDDIKYRHDFVHVVCVVRDIRDIVLSYFEYMNSAGYRSQVPYADYEDIDTFYYDWFLSRLVPAHRFHLFSAEYAERGVPIIRYERLVSNTAGELLRLFKRWDEPIDAAKIEKAVRMNLIETLRREGKRMGSVTMHPTHFNRGEVGRYREGLPAHIVRDIETRFGHVLARWGYR